MWLDALKTFIRGVINGVRVAVAEDTHRERERERERDGRTTGLISFLSLPPSY